MKAWVLYGPDDLRFEEAREPVLSGEEDRDKAIVKVMSCGICGSDIPRIFKTGAHNHPLIPGHEFAGKVAYVGKQENEGLVGKKVGVFPLIPCKECSSCRQKKYEMCRNYDYLGSRSNGAFSEYVKVPIWNLIEIPENIPYETAAMMEPMAVALHAIRQTGIIDRRGSEAVVIGLGTIGLFTTMFLHGMGIRVRGIANKKEPLQKFMAAGLKQEDFFLFSDLRSGAVSHDLFSDTDTVFECVGTCDSFETAVSIAPPGAHIAAVGNPATDMSLNRNVYWKILRNQLIIHGTWNSSFTHDEDDDWHSVLRILSEGKADPSVMISHRFSLDELMQGLVTMRDKTEYYTKVMMSTVSMPSN